uniref:Uncharacterized protein n=1 Tax=Hyaloperonospora arabidopsidis (strain Emoy2) TaxID=559515 RepID=M4BBI0_HYAAE
MMLRVVFDNECCQPGSSIMFGASAALNNNFTMWDVQLTHEARQKARWSFSRYMEGKTTSKESRPVTILNRKGSKGFMAITK